MREIIKALSLASLVVSGCAVPLARPAPDLRARAAPDLRARPASDLLAQGDAELVSSNYGVAVDLYDRFLRTNPDDAAVPRVRATRAILDRLLESEAAMARVRQEALSREEELTRVRQELTALRAEATRLRADLERLKALDLQLEQQSR